MANVHKDEFGRPMDELVIVTLTRSDWYMVRNQLRNMADDWERTNHTFMANRCRAIAGSVQNQVYDTPIEPETVQPPVQLADLYTMPEAIDELLKRLEGDWRVSKMAVRSWLMETRKEIAP